MTPNDPGQGRIDTSYRAGPLSTLADFSQRWLSGKLQSALQSADAGLFELGGSSRDNAQQNYYFEAMAELRGKRAQVASRWIADWLAHYEVLQNPGSDEVSGRDCNSPDARSDTEELECIRVIAETACAANADALAQLTENLQRVLGRSRLDNDSNPYSPRCLLQNCRHSFAELDVDPEICMLLYREFDRQLLQSVNTLYQSCIKRLESAETMPAPRPAPAPTPQKSASSAPPGSAASAVPSKPSAGKNADKEDGHESVALLRALLDGGTAAAAPLTGTTPVPTAILNDLLCGLQSAGPDPDEKVAVALPERVKTTLLEATGGHFSTISRSDEGTISLISMLFEAMLQDCPLADPVVALLWRLQIPMLRLALFDREFFSRKNHPVRQLLNDIGTACIGYPAETELDRDPLFKQLETGVTHICEAESLDLELFNSLRRDFQAAARKLQRRAAMLQDRVIGAERASAQSQDAQRVVGRLLQRRLERASLPPAAVHLLCDAVGRWLQLMYLREGPGSDGWKQCVAQFDDYVALLSMPLSSADSMSAVDRDTGFTELGEALSSLGDPPIQIQQQLDQVRRELDQALTRGTVGDDDGQTLLSAGAPMLDKPGTGALNAEQRLERALKELQDPPPAEEILAQVDQLEEKQWIQLRRPDGKLVRGQLVLSLPSIDKYIFLDRLGQRTIETNRETLGRIIARSDLELINTVVLFDTALDTLNHRLDVMEAAAQARAAERTPKS